MDDDDIPPPVSNDERRSSSSSRRSDDVSFIDERPLTALETPFEHSHEEEEKEEPADQTNKHEIHPIKLLEFLPDVVEDNQEDFTEKRI